MINAVIYTAMIGGTDKLKPIRVKQQVPCIAFTDKVVKCKGWDVRPITDLPEDVPGHCVTISRYYKLLPHRIFPPCEYSIWVDATNTILSDLTTPIPFDEDWISYKPARMCVYKELKAIVSFRRDTREAMDRLTEKYLQIGVPRNVGLAACGIIWRKHTTDMIDFGERWWQEFLAGECRRDMPPWGICNWRNPIKTKLIEGDGGKNKWVRHSPHIRKIPWQF